MLWSWHSWSQTQPVPLGSEQENQSSFPPDRLPLNKFIFLISLGHETCMEGSQGIGLSSFNYFSGLHGEAFLEEH